MRYYVPQEESIRRTDISNNSLDKLVSIDKNHILSLMAAIVGRNVLLHPFWRLLTFKA